MTRLYVALTDAVVHRHRWSAGQMLVFDNYTFLHGRAGDDGVDPERELYRIWLDPIDADWTDT